jgi:hypothetical protein
LTKRAFTGRGTFYYTDVGLGACGECLFFSHCWGSFDARRQVSKEG